MLEKKAHENWVSARQAERRLEDAKQEAAQLRNRLTLRERTLNEEKGQNRKLMVIKKRIAILSFKFKGISNYNLIAF